MKNDFNTIINRMKKAYFEETGREVAPESEVDMRFRAVATELFSVFSYGDYIVKQAFAQTATGKHLDYHAGLRGIIRKTASKAFGSITFSIAEACEQAVVIPKGTICSVSDMPFIQFETEQAATIEAGSLTVTVAAVAIESGARFNVAAGSVDTVVNAPVYVCGVTNENAFRGGRDDESDEGLRERLLTAYKYESNGINAVSVRNILLTIDDILDASIYGKSSIVYICLKTKSGSVDNMLINKINEKIGVLKLCSNSMKIFAAEEKLFNATVDVKAYSGADFNSVRQEVEAAVIDFCKREKISMPVTAEDIARCIGSVKYVLDANVSLNPSSEGCVICGTSEYLKLDSLQVVVHE